MTQTLSQVAEHDAEQQDVSPGQEGGGVGFVVARSAVHIHEHLEGLDDEVVLELGGRLEALVAVMGSDLNGEVGVQLCSFFSRAAFPFGTKPTRIKLSSWMLTWRRSSNERLRY